MYMYMYNTYTLGRKVVWWAFACINFFCYVSALAGGLYIFIAR